jgi:hypothetical protein
MTHSLCISLPCQLAQGVHNVCIEQLRFYLNHLYFCRQIFFSYPIFSSTMADCAPGNSGVLKILFILLKENNASPVRFYCFEYLIHDFIICINDVLIHFSLYLIIKDWRNLSRKTIQTCSNGRTKREGVVSPF